jgi:hypothetical protein
MPLATALSAVRIEKRIEPFGSVSCSRVSASPGRTALWNFALLISHPA